LPAARPAAVGAFIVGALAIVVVAILFFGGGDVFAPKTKAVVFFAGSVGGLSRGAPVTFRGVQVGSVSSVALVVDPAHMWARIPVYLQLDPDRVTLVSGQARQPLLRRLIKAGLRAKLVSQSLVTGQMLVELDLDPAAPARFLGGAAPSDIPEIPAVQSDLQELTQQLTQAPIAETIAQARRTLAAIEQVANKIDAQIDPLSVSALRALDDAQRTLDSAHRTFDVAGVSIERVQQDASGALGEVHGLAQDGRVQLAGRGQELRVDLLAVKQALAAFDGLMRSANTLLAPHSRARDDFEAMLRDLAAAASTLRGFTQTVDRNPTIILRGRASP